VLKVVKDVHFASYRLCCDDFVHLGHEASTVDFTHVVDLQFDLYALVFGQVISTLC